MGAFNAKCDRRVWPRGWQGEARQGYHEVNTPSRREARSTLLQTSSAVRLVSILRSCLSTIIEVGIIVSEQGMRFSSVESFLTPCVAIALGKFLYIDGGEIITWDGEGEGLLSVYAYSNRTGNINTVQGQPLHSVRG